MWIKPALFLEVLEPMVCRVADSAGAPVFREQSQDIGRGDDRCGHGCALEPIGGSGEIPGGPRPSQSEGSEQAPLVKAGSEEVVLVDHLGDGLEPGRECRMR